MNPTELKSYENRIVAKRNLISFRSKFVREFIIPNDFFRGNYLIASNSKTKQQIHFVILMHSQN